MSDRTIRCVITGNTAGTNTRPEGQPCTCENCRIAADSALLDRVRSECEVDEVVSWEGEQAMLMAIGPTDLLRQFAERMKQD